MSWLAVGIAIGSMILGRLIKPRVKREPAPTFEVPSIEEGRVLPVIFGTEKVSPTIFWWGDAQSAELEEDDVPYNAYYAKMVMALCEGPINTVTDVIFGEKSIATWPTSRASSNNTSQPVMSPELPAVVAFSDTPLPFDLYSLDLFGGAKQGGGVAGRLVVYGGGTGQPFDDVYTEAFPDPTDVSGLPGVCYASFTGLPGFGYPDEITEEGWYWGTSPRPEPVAFVLQRFPAPEDLTGGISRIGDDANPVHCIVELMRNGRWGAGIPAARFNFTSFDTAAQTCYDESLGISFQLDQQTPIEMVIEDILRHIDGELYRDPITGLVNITLARADYVVDELPFFNDNNTVSVRVARPLDVEVVNEVQIRYRRYMAGVGEEVVGEPVPAHPLALGSPLVFWQTKGRNISQVTLHDLTTLIDYGPLDDGESSAPDEFFVLNAATGALAMHQDIYDDDHSYTVDYLAGPGQAGYVDASARQQNNANQTATQEVRSVTYDYKMYTKESLALFRAAFLLRVADGLLDEIHLVVNRDGYNLRPGSVIVVTYAAENIQNLVLRVIDVNFGRLEQDEIELTCVEDVWAEPIEVVNTPPSTNPGTTHPQVLVAPPIAALYCLMGETVMGVQAGDTNLTMEVEHSTSSAGTGATVIFSALPGTSTTFSHAVTGTNFFRVRHPAQGLYIAGPWTPWVSCTSSSTMTGTAECVLPTLTITPSTSTATGSVSLTVTDPQNRVLLVEFRTRSGNAAWSAWATDTSPYAVSVTLDALAASRVEWRVTYLNCDGDETQLTNGYDFLTAATDPSYVVVDLGDNLLPNARELTAEDPITITDGGARGPITIGVNPTALAAYSLQDLCVPIPFLVGYDEDFILAAIPDALTERTVRSRLWFDLTGFSEARLVGRVTADLAGAKIVAQYSLDGSSWDYLDGDAGPVLELDATGDIRGAWVAIAAEAKQDVILRWCTLDGSDDDAEMGDLFLELHAIAEAHRCQLDTVILDDFEGYADTAALLAAWTEVDPDGYCTTTLDTTAPDTGTKCLKIAYDADIDGARADAYAVQTFSGFSPGEPVRVSCRCRCAELNALANDHGIEANGVAAYVSANDGSAYQTIFANVIANGAGEIEVRAGHFNITVASAVVTGRFDQFQFYRDCP